MVNMDGDNFSAGLDYVSGLSTNHNNLQELLRDVEWLTKDRRTEPFYQSISELLDERQKFAKIQLEKKGITPKDEFVRQSNLDKPGHLVKDYGFSQETFYRMSNTQQGKLYMSEIDKILNVPLSNLYIEFNGTMQQQENAHIIVNELTNHVVCFEDNPLYPDKFHFIRFVRSRKN